MLEALDLSALETRCYEALLASPHRSSGQLADDLAISTDAVTEALTVLTQRGLVSATQGEGYVPAPPEVAVEVLILQQREAQARARAYASQLMDRYRDGGAAGQVTEHVELVVGAETVTQRFQQLQQGARNDLVVFVKAPFLTPAAEAVEAERRMLESGVRVRGLYERAALEDPDDTGKVTHLLRAGEQARVIDRVPFKLAVADRSLALVPFDADAPGRASAFLVRPCGLLSALNALVDALWEMATPLTPEAGLPEDDHGILDGRDREVLQLLQAGLTDAAIARRLGTSERTIGRRVRRLMDDTGARTRFQLGWRAAERGWIRVEPLAATGSEPVSAGR